MQFPRNPPSVAFPRETFGTDNYRGAVVRDCFEHINPFFEIVRNKICNVAALPESAEFFTEIMIFNPLALQKILEIFFVEYLKFAFRETPHIDQCLNIICMEYLHKIFFTSPVCPEGINFSHHNLLEASPAISGSYFVPAIKKTETGYATMIYVIAGI
jgi:hypothetical protein